MLYRDRIISAFIAVNPISWRRDEEFARQMLAATNPVCIKRVTKFPLTSDLDRTAYGDQDSKITEGHIEKNMSGMTLQQVLLISRQFSETIHALFSKQKIVCRYTCTYI
jgi:hypothetical protein